MQLTNESMRHTAEGAEFMENGGGDSDGLYMDGEEGGRGRPPHRDLSTAQEREEYGKVGMRSRKLRNAGNAVAGIPKQLSD